jgi:hypothetical protein
MKIITPEFPGSYVHLAQPHSVSPDQDPKFSLQIVLPKDDPFWAKLEKASKEIAAAKWGGKVPKGLRSTVNDGDATDREEVQGCNYMTVSCSEDRRPEVVDRNMQKVIEPSELYSGAIYRASLRGYAWDNKFGKGISFGLSNVMKVADGERIDGRTSASSDFEGLEYDDADADDLL